MSQFNSIISELEASRRVSQELALRRHSQEAERSRIEAELQNLRRSRQDYMEAQVQLSQLEYQKKLTEDSEVSEEHLSRRRRASAEQARFAQQDFEREKQQLVQERGNQEALNLQCAALDRRLVDLQSKSRLVEEDEDRKLLELNARKSSLLRLL
jgi:hypothetical protein